MANEDYGDMLLALSVFNSLGTAVVRVDDPISTPVPEASLHSIGMEYCTMGLLTKTDTSVSLGDRPSSFILPFKITPEGFDFLRERCGVKIPRAEAGIVIQIGRNNQASFTVHQDQSVRARDIHISMPQLIKAINETGDEEQKREAKSKLRDLLQNPLVEKIFEGAGEELIKMLG